LNGNRGYLLTTFIRIEGPKPQMKPCRPTLQRSRAGVSMPVPLLLSGNSLKTHRN